MTKWLSHRMVERGIIKEEEQELYQFGIRNGMILLLNVVTALVIGLLTEQLAGGGGCGSVYPFFYGSSQLYRWISLRQQDFLLPWFQSGAAGSGLYTGCVLQDIAGKAAGSIAGVRRDHFFTQPHAQQEPETG